MQKSRPATFFNEFMSLTFITLNPISVQRENRKY
jgi:hypothetical protein